VCGTVWFGMVGWCGAGCLDCRTRAALLLYSIFAMNKPSIFAMNKPSLLVLAILLVALAGFYLLGSGAATDSPLGLDPGNAGTRVAEASKLPPARSLEDEVERSAVGSTLKDLESDPMESITPWPANGLELELIDAATGNPAAGALVWHKTNLGETPELKLWGLLNGLALERDELDSDELAGVPVYQANQAGHVRIPDLPQSSLVIAHLGRARGYLAPNSRFSSGQRIELTEPVGLVFEVENTQGSPVPGCPLSFAPDLGALISANAITDETGSFRLFNVNTLVVPVQVAHGRSVLEPMEVRAGTADPRGRATVELLELPSVPVVLVVPEGGVVKVEVVPLAGQSLPKSSVVVQLILESDGATRPLQRRVEPGEAAWFSGLEPGARVTASLLPGGSLGTAEPVSGTISRSGAESLELSLLVDSTVGSFLTGRLVDAEGHPHAATPFVYKIFISGKTGTSSMQGPGETDADGRFRIAYASSGGGPIPGMSQTQFQFKIEKRGATPRLGLTAKLSGKLELPMDLGDVFVVEPPLLAAGRVVDENRQPVAGIRVFASVPNPQFTRLLDSGLPASTLAINGVICTETQADGTFEVLGTTTAGELFLQPWMGVAAVGAMQRVALGARGLELIVQTKGSLFGSVHLLEVQDASSWLISIRPQDPDQRQAFFPKSMAGLSTYSSSGKVSVNILASGDFGWHQLEPGLYTVSLLLDGLKEPLTVWKDVSVEGGKVCRDPRLQEIDTTGLLEPFRLSIVDSAGLPIPGATSALLDTSQKLLQTATLPTGTGELSFQGQPATIVVGAPGHFARAMTFVPGQMEISMKKAFEVTLYLPSGILVPEGLTLSAALLPTAGLWKFLPRDDASEFFVFHDGEAHVTPTALGVNAFRVRIGRGNEFSRTTSERSLPKPGNTVELGANSAGARYLIPVTASVLD
jgi:hypothetical protein